MAVEKWKTLEESNLKIFNAYLEEKGMYTIKDRADTGIGILLKLLSNNAVKMLRSLTYPSLIQIWWIVASIFLKIWISTRLPSF